MEGLQLEKLPALHNHEELEVAPVTPGRTDAAPPDSGTTMVGNAETPGDRPVISNGVISSRSEKTDRVSTCWKNGGESELKNSDTFCWISPCGWSVEGNTNRARFRAWRSIVWVPVPRRRHRTTMRVPYGAA